MFPYHVGKAFGPKGLKCPGRGMLQAHVSIVPSLGNLAQYLFLHSST